VGHEKARRVKFELLLTAAAAGEVEQGPLILEFVPGGGCGYAHSANRIFGIGRRRRGCRVCRS
jgi:hypothetical protein